MSATYVYPEGVSDIKNLNFNNFSEMGQCMLSRFYTEIVNALPGLLVVLFIFQ